MQNYLAECEFRETNMKPYSKTMFIHRWKSSSDTAFAWFIIICCILSTVAKFQSRNCVLILRTGNSHKNSFE